MRQFAKMNLPDQIKSLLRPKQTREMFLSLVLGRDGVAASAWYVNTAGQPQTIAFAKTDIEKDSWEDLTQACDRAIAAVEEKVDGSTQIRKAVLGLPADYLTQNGDIDPSIRSHIKQLTQALDLTAIGFVSLPQALVYKLKKDEGMPPSVILLGFGDSQIILTLYKVGTIIGQYVFERGEHLASSVESTLKNFKELEVLPSRILLYGMQTELLEEGKTQLLAHPWPTRTNFLHFPKFDTVSAQDTTTAVSLAGASELSTDIGSEEDELPLQEPQQKEEEATPEDKQPVKIVAAEELGFQKEDILEEIQNQKSKIQTEKETDEFLKFRLPIDISRMKLHGLTPVVSSPRTSAERNPPKQKTLRIHPWAYAQDFLRRRIKLPKLPSLPFTLPKIHLRGGVAIAGALLGALLIFSVINWILPRATVTVLALPQTLESSVTVTVDPTATIADSQNNIIPGTTREDEFSGEKTIAVSGTKKIGDPAKGAITIYNKSLTVKQFKKGSVLTTSALRFTLNSDVQVASATESIGSITFGKTTSAITAEAIGPEGNRAAGTEFIFTDVSSSTAVARNDTPLTGGTSREVTVVTRGDYDTLTKEITDELLAKAKQKLATSITGSAKLIDATLKTTVTEKVFAQELDEEAKEVSGKITITVSGVSYSDADLTSIFENSVRDKLQTGYALVKERTQVSVQNVQVKKDGTSTMTVKISGVAIPTIDSESVRQSIAGKHMTRAQEYLQRTVGVGGVEFRFRWTIIPNRLPMNKNNISVTIAVQE